MPNTETAFELQLPSFEQSRSQLGYPENPSAHISQSSPANPCGHAPHDRFDHAFRHEQLQLGAIPTTPSAWLLQSRTTSHGRTQFGKPSNPGRQAKQSAWRSTPGGHWSHVVPFQRLRHVHAQPVIVSPETLVAWKLQSSASHARVHNGGAPS